MKEKKEEKVKATPAQPAEETVKETPAEDASKETSSTPPPSSETSQTSETSQPPQTPNPTEPDWKTLYALVLADFDNYKKRAARDREDVYRYAEADILKDILPTVDNLSLALANAKNKDDEFVKGVQLVYDTLLKALKEHGAEPFDSIGQTLDTEKMEAIATLPSADVAEGLVSNEAKRGWMLKDKVLRAAQVVISSGAPQ